MTPAPRPEGGRGAAQLLLLFCVIVWGWTFVATKVCLLALRPVELVGLRFLIGLPLLASIVALRRRTVELSRSDVAALALGAAVITVHFLLQAVALEHTSATNTAWIIAVSPLVIALLARVFLAEPVKSRAWSGLGLATVGVLLLVSRGRIHELGWLGSRGDWLVLASAGTWALYTIATRNLSRTRDPLTVALFAHVPLLATCLAAMAARSELHALVHLPARVVIALAFLGVLGTLAQWFWQEGLARLGATRAGAFLYLEPLATMVLAVPLLGEAVGWSTWVGGTLILTGVWLAERV